MNFQYLEGCENDKENEENLEGVSSLTSRLFHDVELTNAVNSKHGVKNGLLVFQVRDAF